MSDVPGDPTIVLCGQTQYCSRINASHRIEYSRNILFSADISFSERVAFSKGVKCKKCVLFNREFEAGEYKTCLEMILQIFPRPQNDILDIKGYWKSITVEQWERLAFFPSFDGTLVNDIIEPYIGRLDFSDIRNAARIKEVTRLGVTISLPDSNG